MDPPPPPNVTTTIVSRSKPQRSGDLSLFAPGDDGLQLCHVQNLCNRQHADLDLATSSPGLASDTATAI
ncbi:hypothetical protein CH63R_07232 [Colletotrichum higginsianum IMI 349063]|uniref:Uncharacterized protein n=1 Tax=Colletotrichum higginsianum (strain IMI 349063) TaxID=759273 RepID=A0A1B7Y924_COLHI|nr:hypothetical protein CH63R_07232 [Colletotrichum higginsianum IMI 349063]OBR08467.1 hypothetical protein CH63R_07232 [Colletotrichum higginsianum IMI 349063]